MPPYIFMLDGQVVDIYDEIHTVIAKPEYL